MALIDNIHKKPGMHRQLLDWGEDGTFFGWSFEEMGWNMARDGQLLDG